MISRVSSLERTFNSDSTSPETSAPKGATQLNPALESLNTNPMATTDVWLPTFNGNGMEDPEQHWFLCEAVWMVCLVHGTDVKKVQMITTLRGRTLDWFMKFCAAPIGTPQKTLEEIRVVMIFEFRKPKLESQCITKNKEIKRAPVETVWDFDQ